VARARPFGTIREMSGGRFQARYYHLGRQVAADTTFPTKRAARAWLSSVETEIKRGDHVEPTNADVAFDRYAKQWLTDRQLRPRTRATYESQLDHILATFGRARLGEITAYDVRQWHGRMNRSDLNANTVAKVYRLFRTIMATAIEDGFLRSNPVAIKGASTERVAERPLLDWDDVERLAAAIEPRFSAMVWTAAVAGLRFGELAALDRQHVDVNAGRSRVDRALTFEKGVGATYGPPKSLAAHRTVTIPPVICNLLEAHMQEFVEPGNDAVLFRSTKGSLLLNRYFSPYWDRAKRKADVDDSVRFHDLRHLAGTAAASAGGSLREVMARMGHQSSNAALRYLKAAEARDREIADALGQHLSTATKLTQRAKPTTLAG
jgi:integrase